MRRQDAVRTRSATLVERALAYVIDAVVTFGLWAGLAVVITRGEVDQLPEDPLLTLLVAWLFLLVPLVYFVLAEGVYGTTPGKRALGLRLVGPRDGPPGLYAATVRNVLRLAWALGPVGPAFLALDALLVQWTERDQRVGDLAAETRVVATGRGPLALS